MPEENKSKRRYNSARRQEQARQTRLQILEAARHLFSQRGYAGTTFDAIAQEAGVATETVYAVFGSKRTVLARLVDYSVAGDELPLPLLQRPEIQAVRRDPDQRSQVHGFALGIQEIMSRVAPLFEVMRTAAKTEDDIAELLQSLLSGRLAGMREFIQSLAAHGPLREGLTIEAAAETTWAITSPEIYRLLTGDRGMTAEQYTRWLEDALIRLLLPAQ